MVMKKNAMRKNLRQSILKSLGRYIAIVAIIALGASMFVGLLMTKADMVATGQKYMDEQNMFDLRLVSSYGWDPEQLDEIRQLEGIVDAEGLIYLDAIAEIEGVKDDSVFRFYAIPETVNQLSLRGGRMPTAPDECLIDGYIAGEELLGTQITVSEQNEEATLDAMVYKTYTIVGYVATPLYMDMNRGTTSVGSGSLETYLFLPRESFDVDYYTEIHVTLPGDYDVYTDKYNDAMEAAADRLEPVLKPLADNRYRSVKADAIQTYRDGMVEYFEGVMDFNKGKAEAEQELADAYQQLLDAEEEIAEGEKQLVEGEAELRNGKNQLYMAQKELDAGREEFEEQKGKLYEPLEQTMNLLQMGTGGIQQRVENYEAQIREVDEQLSALEEEGIPGDSELAALNSRIMELEVRISYCRTSIQAAQGALELANRDPELNATFISYLEGEIASLQEELASSQSQWEELVAQRDSVNENMGDAYQKRQELENERTRLQSELDGLKQVLTGIESTVAELNEAKAMLDEQFADAEKQLQDGQAQINSGWAQISASEKEIEKAKLDLEQGKLDLEQGWKDYEEGKAEAEQEISDAEAELADAKEQLDDGLKQIQEMKELSLYILDRNSNVGYGSLDSSSDIVQGVSRVFPAFFLLVAALVCITTMTRMIDEERTQIGTLKALGYSNGAIISKYLIYAGSGAVIGCGLGVLVGSVAFPTILWQAYKIMLYITDGIVLKFNWWLCGIVVFAYTAVMLLVTWYCCRKALEEQPAELIRPKAPEAGKKIFLERLPFWHRLSFLNKVTIRNIFRYRQRLAMMMVGIGGCTALLLTGFGLRDSIVNVVNYQFEEVTVYDLQVYFEKGQSPEEQLNFQDEVAYAAENVLFYHQESMELEFENHTKEIYVMVSQPKIQEFIDFHSGTQSLSMPGVGEVLLSVGAAEAMGIDVGDQVIMRNADMEMLELTVSGIYDNHVYNYAVLKPETISSQLGYEPEQQMALVQAAQGQDVHALSADITGMRSVMNVTVSEDMADMVGNMMKALDLVVWVIVFCAGLLAAIVLYNLTNININERIREIATIKVLGFNAGETAAYVFKENLSLTAVGSVVGLGLGYLLLLFVMSQVKIDMVWFKALIMPVSYVLSLVLTMVAACVVDLIFYFRLDKINMAEALKSVE